MSPYLDDRRRRLPFGEIGKLEIEETIIMAQDEVYYPSRDQSYEWLLGTDKGPYPIIGAPGKWDLFVGFADNQERGFTIRDGRGQKICFSFCRVRSIERTDNSSRWNIRMEINGHPCRALYDLSLRRGELFVPTWKIGW